VKSLRPGSQSEPPISVSESMGIASALRLSQNKTHPCQL
jgi:hypothetical protein